MKAKKFTKRTILFNYLPLDDFDTNQLFQIILMIGYAR